MLPQEAQENTHKEQPVAALQDTTTSQKQCRKSVESRHSVYQVKTKKKTKTVTKQHQCCTHTVAQNKHTPGPVTETQHRKIL